MRVCVWIEFINVGMHGALKQQRPVSKTYASVHDIGAGKHQGYPNSESVTSMLDGSKSVADYSKEAEIKVDGSYSIKSWLNSAEHLKAQVLLAHTEEVG